MSIPRKTILRNSKSHFPTPKKKEKDITLLDSSSKDMANALQQAEEKLRSHDTEKIRLTQENAELKAANSALLLEKGTLLGEVRL